MINKVARSCATTINDNLHCFELKINFECSSIVVALHLKNINLPVWCGGVVSSYPKL